MYWQAEKKLVKQQYLLHMSSQYGKLWPTNGWDRFSSLRHPSKFQRVSCLRSVTAPTSHSGLVEVNQSLHDVWPFPGLIRCIHFRGLLPPNGILPDAESTLHSSLAFSYIGSVTARHASSGRQPNCGVVSPRVWAAIPFDIGRSNCLLFYIFMAG